MAISLRPVEDADLDAFFSHMQDEGALRMAAFTPADPTDRAAFDAKWSKMLQDPTIIARTVLSNGDVAGSVSKWELDGEPQLTYWIGREFWGRGVATEAVRLFLAEVTERPFYAGAAKDNLGSIRVLEKCGFVLCGEDKGFANARGEEIEEIFMRLD